MVSVLGDDCCPQPVMHTSRGNIKKRIKRI
jgi:hypothetical protein